MFAPDTNTFIYFFKGVGRVKDHLFSVSPVDVAIPSVVLYELEVGIAQSNQPSKRRAQLDALLATINVLSFNAAAAR